MNYIQRIYDLLVEAQLGTIPTPGKTDASSGLRRTPFQGPSVARNYQPSKADNLAEKPITRYDPKKASKQEHAFKKAARTPKIVPGK